MQHPERWPGDLRSRRRFLRNSAGLFALAAGSAFAQTRFPVRPVRIIVPFPPGQAADIAARMLAQKLTALWAQQVVVDNRGGGLGIPAMVLAKSSPADGYTLAMGTTQTLCVNPALRRNLPYDLSKDFTAVSGVVSTPLLFIAHPSFPARSIRDLVALAQKSPTPSSSPARASARRNISPVSCSPHARASSCSTSPTRAARRRSPMSSAARCR